MEKKECFGVLDKIFPVNKSGLREIVPECFNCSDRIACLKEAIATKEGVEMRLGILERAPTGGLMNRIRRWSQKKELSLHAEEREEKKRCEELFDSQEELKGTEEVKGYKASPWERRSDLGLWQGIYRTFNSVLFSPKNFFGNMTNTGGIKEPLAFGLLLGSMGTMFALFWQFLIIYGQINSAGTPIPDKVVIDFLFMGIIIISPVFVIMYMFITSAVIYVFLAVFRGGERSFEGTFRVVAFSQATRILKFIPLIGELADWCWNLLVLIIGLRSIHGTSYVKAITAVLLTLILKGLTFLPFFLIKSIILTPMAFTG